MWTLSLKETLIGYWLHVQHELLPWLDDAVGPLGEHHRQLVGVLCEIAATFDHISPEYT